MRVLVVDDHPLFRRGLVAALSSRSGLEVVGEAADGEEALERARATRPDLIFMDVSMPRRDGLEATRAIKAELPQTRVIVLTVSDRDEDLFAAIKSGVDGYLLKNLQPSQLFQMLEALERGEAAITGALAARILQELREVGRDKRVPADGQDTLSLREREVLELVARGERNKNIATALGISEETVKNHLSNILAKLHAQNRTQAAVLAVRQGLFEP